MHGEIEKETTSSSHTRKHDGERNGNIENEILRGMSATNDSSANTKTTRRRRKKSYKILWHSLATIFTVNTDRLWPARKRERDSRSLKKFTTIDIATVFYCCLVSTFFLSLFPSFSRARCSANWCARLWFVVSIL